MEEPRKPIDYAATKSQAIELRDLYQQKAKVLGLAGEWLIGYEEDPVRGPDGRHGFLIYAKPKLPGPLLEPQRKPADDAIEPTAVIPPQQVRVNQRPNRRHPNRRNA